MAKMTRYTRPGIQVAQPQSIDFAGLREAGRMGQAISQQVDRMSAFLEKQAQAEAEFKAGEIIREKGAAAATDIRAAGGPKTYMEKQVYESGMRIASSELETNALGEINRVLLDAETNHLTPAQLRTNLDEIADGFPAALSDLDGNVAGLLRSKLQGHIDTAQTKYMGIHSKWVAQQEQGRALLGLESRENLALDTVGLPVDKATREAAFEAHLADGAQFMRDRNFDEKAISKWMIDTRKKGVIDSNLSDFNRLPTMADKTAYLEKLQKNPPKGLSRDETRTLISALRADMTNTTKIYAAEVSAVKDTLKDQVKIMTNGGVPSSENLMKLEARVAALPATSQGGLLDDINRLKSRASQMSVYRTLPPAILEQEIRDLSQGKEGIGGKGVDTLLESELLKDAKGLYTTMKTAVKEDHLSWAAQTGMVKLEPLPIDQMINGMSGDTDALGKAQAAVDNRIQVAKNQAGRLGAPVISVMTKQEANLFNQLYSQAKQDVKLGYLQAINKFFGGDAKYVFDQLADADPVMGYVGGLVEQGLPDNAGYALRGYELIDAKVDYEFDKILANQTFDTMVGRAFGGQVQAKAAARQTAEAIYTELARSRNTLGTYDDKLWKEAIKLSTGYNRFNRTGGIEEVRDKPVLLPNGITSEDIETTLENITADELSELSGGIYADPAIVKDINESDNIYPIALQDGVYALAYDDTNGVPVTYTTPGGEVFTINIKQYLGKE